MLFRNFIIKIDTETHPFRQQKQLDLLWRLELHSLEPPFTAVHSSPTKIPCLLGRMVRQCSRVVRLPDQRQWNIHTPIESLLTTQFVLATIFMDSAKPTSSIVPFRIAVEGGKPCLCEVEVRYLTFRLDLLRGKVGYMR